MLEWITMPEAWIALATLTALEIVLGIDNIIFLSILVDRLPEKQRPKARLIGLSLAMVMRLGLLASLAWLTKLTADLFMVLGQGISGRDLVLVLGGLFLLAKSVLEIHHSIEATGLQPAGVFGKFGGRRHVPAETDDFLSGDRTRWFRSDVGDVQHDAGQ